MATTAGESFTMDTAAAAGVEAIAVVLTAGSAIVDEQSAYRQQTPLNNVIKTFLEENKLNTSFPVCSWFADAGARAPMARCRA